MAICSACDTENPQVARFCLACGTAISGETRLAEERRIVSVIFVDLVGFTSRSERLDPEEVQAFLAPYHDRVRREIESFGGIVEKFIGDAVVGMFGAPVAHGDDAERAVRAALVIRDIADELAGGDLQVRIAVNTGLAMVSIGARAALGESMVVGDVVNTASRLQSAAPLNGVLVGAETYLTTKDAIEYEPAEPVIAKGKEHPVPAWVAVRAITESGMRASSPGEIVGREHELAVLSALWNRAVTARSSHLVTIFGPAGIGKSTLAAEFGRMTAAANARVVFGRSLPYRESGTYGALAGQLMKLGDVYESDAPSAVAEKLHARTCELLAGTAADPAVVAGHLGAVVGIDAGTGAPDRDALFYSVREFLEAAAREQPTILIFEDIHWADPNLLDLVYALAAGMKGMPILFLILSRPDLLDARSDWGAGLPGCTTLTLGPLTSSDGLKLLTRRLGDVDQAEQVLAVAEGNPLFIEQLAASIGEVAPGQLPTNIREVVASRLDALPSAERALLLDAAVIGKVFWVDALHTLNGEHGDALRLLAELERRDLVCREPRSIIEGKQQFAFTHVLIRDVAYELLPRGDRMRRHALAAQFFGESTGGSSEATGALARHWRAAGDNERAVEQLLRAAERAERGWAKDHAAFLYRECLELIPEDDTERRNAVRRSLAIALQAAFHLMDVR